MNKCRQPVSHIQEFCRCYADRHIETVKLPNCNFSFTYSTTVETSFANTCKYRKTGWCPDVIIPLPYPEKLTNNVDDWVLWVAKDMKKKVLAGSNSKEYKRQNSDMWVTFFNHISTDS